MADWRQKRFGQRGGEAFIFLAGLFYHPASDQILELFVSAQAEHFFATAGGISRTQVLVQDLKKLLKLKGSASGEDRNQFFGNKIRDTA